MSSCFPVEVFLHPGDFYFGKAPTQIGTLLGSCVSITVWHPHRNVGGMCHIQLPERQGPQATSPHARYADEAVALFAREVEACRTSASSFQVKLFGGGRMSGRRLVNNKDVGQRNIDAARRALLLHGFRIMTEHVGGTIYRRIHFDLQSGDVQVTLGPAVDITRAGRWLP